MEHGETVVPRDRSGEAAMQLVARPERRVAPAARHCLLAIDLCLEQLEELHLRGRYIARQRGCQQVVANLARALEGTPPESVLQARTSYALHAALLNWQAAVLDQMIPDRQQRFPDLEGERWTVPRVSRLRGRDAAPVRAPAPAARSKAAVGRGAWASRPRCPRAG
ncbi:MAG: hypothetical protein ACYCZN_03725 [Candidatus Dormibacteria bacterium]